jgi:hypothetical protein
MFDDVMDPISATIDNHVEDNHDAVITVTADGPAIPGTPAFCVLYVSARPVLHWVRALLFFKPKWRTVITAVIAGLDAICSGQVAPPVDTPIETKAAIDKKDESLQGD